MLHPVTKVMKAIDQLAPWQQVFVKNNRQRTRHGGESGAAQKKLQKILENASKHVEILKSIGRIQAERHSVWGARASRLQFSASRRKHWHGTQACFLVNWKSTADQSAGRRLERPRRSR